MDDVVAAVDVGTNSIHLVVARVTGGHAADVLAREKEMVRLGSGAGDMKHLADDAVDRAIAVLTRFRQLAEVHDAGTLSAVATSAVREAENRSAFVHRAEIEAGVTVDVISGFEEARLIYLGVLQALPVFDERVVLCDVGGGSTELLLGKQGETLACRSFKLGAIRLTERFFRGDRLHPGAVDTCRRYIRATISSFASTMRGAEFDRAVGSSGTIGALCAMAAAADGPAPQTLNGYQLTRSQLGDALLALIRAPTPADRAGLPGLDARRADIILAGALIVEQFLDAVGLEGITFSDSALREGVLLDAWRRRHGGSLHHLSDLRRESVLRLAQLMDEDSAHTSHVARLVLELFDQTASRHSLGDDAREYLEAAALLCNVGLFVSHGAHHKHTYYVIRNSDHLSGFTDREIELIALIARYHRKSAPKASHAEFAALSDADQEMVRVCAGLLRIALGLDRSHDARVVQIVATESEAPPGLTLSARARPDADITLELFSADQGKALLQDTLGVAITLV